MNLSRLSFHSAEDLNSRSGDWGGRGSPGRSEESLDSEVQSGTTVLEDEPVLSIAPGGTATGVINTSGDVDHFTVNLVAGQTYTISVQGSGDGALPDSFLTVSNPGGSVIATDDDGGQAHSSLLTFTAATTGTYQIAAEAYPGSGLTGGYTVDVRQMGSDSVGSTIGSATPINANSTTFGFIETSGDVDMYAVTLTAANIIISRLQAAPITKPNILPFLPASSTPEWLSTIRP